MNDELGNFASTDSSTSVQGRTNIEFENPRHADYEAAYASNEDAQAYFNAATGAKDWPGSRRVLVGEFLVAVGELHEDGSPQRLAEFVATLTGEEAEVLDVTAEPPQADDDSDGD